MLKVSETFLLDEGKPRGLATFRIGVDYFSLDVTCAKNCLCGSHTSRTTFEEF